MKNEFGKSEKLVNNQGKNFQTRNFQANGKSDMRDLDGYFNTLKMQGYYKDSEKKKLDPGFIVKYAKDIAWNLDAEGGSNMNKRTQIRKYYDYLLRVSKKLEHYGMDYSYVAADVFELLPKAQYAVSRKVAGVLFAKFIDKNVTAIQDAEDFKAFQKHFEAIVAYMKKDTK